MGLRIPEEQDPLTQMSKITYEFTETEVSITGPHRTELVPMHIYNSFHVILQDT